eukprot:1253063-Rhodomonas_salina.1
MSCRQHTVSSRLAETSEPAALEASARHGKFLDRKKECRHAVGLDARSDCEVDHDLPGVDCRVKGHGLDSECRGAVQLCVALALEHRGRAFRRVRDLAIQRMTRAQSALVVAHLVRVGSGRARHATAAQSILAGAHRGLVAKAARQLLLGDMEALVAENLDVANLQHLVGAGAEDEDELALGRRCTDRLEHALAHRLHRTGTKSLALTRTSKSAAAPALRNRTVPTRRSCPRLTRTHCGFESLTALAVFMHVLPSWSTAKSAGGSGLGVSPRRCHWQRPRTLAPSHTPRRRPGSAAKCCRNRTSLADIDGLQALARARKRSEQTVQGSRSRHQPCMPEREPRLQHSSSLPGMVCLPVHRSQQRLGDCRLSAAQGALPDRRILLRPRRVWGPHRHTNIQRGTACTHGPWWACTAWSR